MSLLYLHHKIYIYIKKKIKSLVINCCLSLIQSRFKNGNVQYFLLVEEKMKKVKASFYSSGTSSMHRYIWGDWGEVVVGGG